MSFRFFNASIDDLEARLAESQRLAAAGLVSEARELSQSIRKNVARFYPGESDRSPRHVRLLEELERMSL
jgi:hypothetical protein